MTFTFTVIIESRGAPSRLPAPVMIPLMEDRSTRKTSPGGLTFIVFTYDSLVSTVFRVSLRRTPFSTNVAYFIMVFTVKLPICVF